MSEYSGQSRWRAADVRRLSDVTLLSERTVYRWLREPGKATRANQARLTAACRKLGITVGVNAA